MHAVWQARVPAGISCAQAGGARRVLHPTGCRWEWKALQSRSVAANAADRTYKPHMVKVFENSVYLRSSLIMFSKT